MDLCLIPPIAHLKHFKQKRHLVLSHLLQNREYREFYEERRKQGDYIILDNSAHENGIGEGAGKLLLQALDLEPQELVVPDALEDADLTIKFARTALLAWFGSEGRLRGKDIRLMYVPQGKTYEEWRRCLDNLMVLHSSATAHWDVPLNCTIGISKDYAAWDSGLHGLLTYTERFSQRDHIEIHLLGSGHNYWSPRRLGEQFDIRSVDTAKPFVWAMHGLVMRKENTGGLPAQLPKRPREYFSMQFEDLSLANHNAKVLRELIER